jgi:hypothetical protein
VVVEGTGSFGAVLIERLQAAGREVVEAARMPAGDRRGTGKSDELDAVRIARTVLGLATTALRTPRALAKDRARVAMRVLLVARDQMTGERTRAVNALTALVRTIDLGVDFTNPSKGSAAARASATTRATITPTVAQATRTTSTTAVFELCTASHATRSSKARVCPAPWRAHGTAATVTPWWSQTTRGASASR